MAKTDITGQRFGRLVATSPDRLVDSGWLWHCKCDCGTLCSVKMSLLRNGNTKSCGCLKRELIRAKNYRHGLLRRGAASPEYYAFRNAMQRCIDPNDARFADYGGRGIEFRFNSFKEFIEAVGPRPSVAFSIDRKDNAGHYEPGNVKWSTRGEQQKNRRHNAKKGHSGFLSRQQMGR